MLNKCPDVETTLEAEGRGEILNLSNIIGWLHIKR
jgi:hypothetical protein